MPITVMGCPVEPTGRCGVEDEVDVMARPPLGMSLAACSGEAWMDDWVTGVIVTELGTTMVRATQEDTEEGRKASPRMRACVCECAPQPINPGGFGC